MLNRSKYSEAILYLLHHCNNAHLGKTKLMKLLYYLDFDHFEQYGASVTGDTYVKLLRGPVPQKADEILSTMEAEGEIVAQPRQVYDYIQQRWDAVAEPDMTVFSPSEVETLERISAEWGPATLHQIVEATHNEEPWIAVEEGEEIPYVYAYYRDKFPEPLPTN